MSSGLITTNLDTSGISVISDAFNCQSDATSCDAVDKQLIDVLASLQKCSNAGGAPNAPTSRVPIIIPNASQIRQTTLGCLNSDLLTASQNS